MHILLSAVSVLVGAAIGLALSNRQSAHEEVPRPEDEPATEEQSALAEMLRCTRRMDPLTLTGASEATFILADGTERCFHITGEGSQHLQTGESGMLTWAGENFILFEKDKGEIIGGMFYSPAESEDATDE